MSDKTKKILVWCSIIIVMFVVAGTFMIQFFGWDTWLEVQTANYGKVTLPSILVGGFLFWLPILVLGTIIDQLKERVETLNKKAKKSKKK